MGALKEAVFEMSTYQYDPAQDGPGWEVLRQEEVLLREQFNAEDEGLLAEVPEPVRSAVSRVTAGVVVMTAAVLGAGMLG